MLETAFFEALMRRQVALFQLIDTQEQGGAEALRGR